MNKKKATYFIEYSYVYYEYTVIEEVRGYMPISDFNCGLFYCTYDEVQNEVEKRVKEHLNKINVDYKDLEVNIKNCYLSSDLNQLDLPLCPKCSNEDVFVKRGMMTDLFICRKCGYEWR